MIHIIYSYFIIAGVALGFFTGDNFDRSHPFVKLVVALFWLPVCLFNVLKYFALKIWNLDIIQLTRVHLGVNVYEGNDNVHKIIAHLENKMVPIWSKWTTGRYYISGLAKLKKMNTGKPTITE